MSNGGWSLLRYFLTTILFSLNIAYSSPEPSNLYLQQLDSDLGQREFEIQKQIESLSSTLVRTYTGPESGPVSIWRESDVKSRKNLQSLVSASIKAKLKELAEVQKQRKYLQGELKFSSQELPTLAKLRSKSESCQIFPLKLAESTTIEKKFNFGASLNPELGQLSPKSQGTWWKNTAGLMVQSCLGGQVVFRDFIEAKGFVVVVRHGDDFLSVYGGIKPESAEALKIGTRVAAGSVLGLIDQDFYFEVRKKSEAINPEAVLPKQEP